MYNYKSKKYNYCFDSVKMKSCYAKIVQNHKSAASTAYSKDCYIITILNKRHSVYHASTQV